MTEVPETIDSKFRLVLLAAQRAEQLMRGASPRVTTKHNRRARIALDEIRSDAVNWGYGPADAQEPTEPVAEAAD
jgi:DNA-directed RNA polymerase omega subunit